MVQLALRPGHERDIVRRVAARQPRDDQVIVVQVVNDPLSRMEPHDLLVEPLQRRGVLGGDHGVVDPGDADPDQVTRERLGIDQPHVRADILGLGIQLDDMIRGQHQPHAVTDREVVALAHPLSQAAELTGPLLQFLQVSVPLHLVTELHHADAALFQDDRVVIELIPPLVIQPARLLVHQLHAERLPVM